MNPSVIDIQCYLESKRRKAADRPPSAQRGGRASGGTGFLADLQDVQRAAEAVVDAALVCRQHRDGAGVSAEQRQELIDAVLRDPLLTGDLFKNSAKQG